MNTFLFFYTNKSHANGWYPHLCGSNIILSYYEKKVPQQITTVEYGWIRITYMYLHIERDHRRCLNSIFTTIIQFCLILCLRFRFNQLALGICSWSQIFWREEQTDPQKRFASYLVCLDYIEVWIECPFVPVSLSLSSLSIHGSYKCF